MGQVIMPCYRCGTRQVDPDRGESPWKRGVRADRQVLVCPGCQSSLDWMADLDRCPVCASVRLVRRLGEVECRACGGVGQPVPAPARAASGSSLRADGEPGAGGRLAGPDVGAPKVAGPQDAEPQDGKPQDGKPQDGKPQDGKPLDVGEPQDGEPRQAEPEGSRPDVRSRDDREPDASDAEAAAGLARDVEQALARVLGKSGRPVGIS